MNFTKEKIIISIIIVVFYFSINLLFDIIDMLITFGQ